MTRSKLLKVFFDNSHRHLRTSSFIMSAGVLLCGPAVQMASAENYANQLQLQNCGAYVIDTIYAEYRKAGGSWKTLRTITTNLDVNQTLCVDFQYYTDQGSPVVNYGDEIRLRVDIESGEANIKCDDTNYPETVSQPNSRRKLRMKGTTFNNNRCRSKGYAGPYIQSNCSGGGAKKDEPC